MLNQFAANASFMEKPVACLALVSIMYEQCLCQGDASVVKTALITFVPKSQQHGFYIHTTMTAYKLITQIQLQHPVWQGSWLKPCII